MTRLSGQVTLSESPVQGVPVAVIDTNNSEDPTNWSIVATDVTDANGDWQVTGLSQNAVERYHALVQYDDGSQLYNVESLPYLSTDAYLSASVQTWEWDGPTATISTPDLIPDSAIHRWILDDVNGSMLDSIGSLTLNNENSGIASIAGSGIYQGDSAGDGDGSNRAITSDSDGLGGFGSTTDTDFAIAFTVDDYSPSSAQNAMIMGIDQAPETLQLNVGNTNTGDLNFVLTDSSGNVLAAETDSGHIADANIHRVIINKVANTGSGAIEFYVADDADSSYSQVAATVYTDQGFSNPSDFSIGFALFGRNTTYDDFRPVDMVLDDVIIYDDSLTSSERQGDLDLQPNWGGGSGGGGGTTTETLSLIASNTDADYGAPHDASYSGDYVYSAGKDGTLASTDVSSPSSPTVADSVTTLTEAQMTNIDDGDSTVLYVGDQSNLRTMDISDPTALTETNALSIGSNVQPNGSIQSGESLYVACKEAKYIEADVSTPSSPSITQTWDTPSGHSPHDVAFGDGTVFGVNQTQGTSEPQVVALDPTDLTVVKDSVEDLGNLEGANRVQFYNGYVYVACNYADTVAVFDWDGSALANVGVYTTRSPEPSGLELDEGNDKLFVGCLETVSVYDITDPTELTEAAYYDFGSTESIHDPTLPFDSGTRVAWTGQATDSLHITDT